MRYAEQLGVGDRVRFWGEMPLDDWSRFLQGSGIFLYMLPANSYAAVDSTLQDAMKAGVPVIYYGPAGPEELLRHEENSLIARSVEEIPELVERMVNEGELRRRCISNAMFEAEVLKDYKRIAEGYSRIYMERLASGIEVREGLRKRFIGSLRIAKSKVAGRARYYMRRMQKRV